MAETEADLAHLAVRYGFLTEDQARECRDEAQRRGVPLIEILMDRGFLCASDITTLKAVGALKGGNDLETLSLKIVERGYATGEQVEKWIDDWTAISDPRPKFLQFLLHRGWLSSDQVNQMDAPQATGDIAVGSRFGKYQIQSVLGEGATGYVFKALDLDLQRTVAIKILKQTESLLPQHLQRFLREAKIMANLRHPNIVPVYEVGLQDNRYYFTMEHIQGVALDAAFESKKLGLWDVVEIVETVSRALSFAHQCGVVHRDLKPSNIMLDNRAPRIMDFGLAKVDNEDVRLTKTGTVLGSPVYMSPEQVEGRIQVDGRTDVYTLGVILYEGVTGNIPFDAPQMADLFSKILEGEAIPPRRRVPGVPADLEKVILKAMERDPARRYATAQELAEDLRRLREGEPVKASGASKFTLFIRRVKKHRKMVYSAVAAGLVVLLGAGVFELYRAREASRIAQVKIQLDDARATIADFDRAVLSHRQDVLAMIPRMNRSLDQLSKLDRPEAEILRGKILMRRGRRDEAEACFARYPELADLDRAMNLLLKSFPEKPAAVPDLAERVGREGAPGTALAAVFAGNPAAALSMLKDMIAKAEGREQADLRKVQALLLGMARDYDRASKAAEEALRVRRVDPDLLWISGYAHINRPHDDQELRREDMKRAIERLDEALKTGVDAVELERLLTIAYGNWAAVAEILNGFDENFYREGDALFESVLADRRDADYAIHRGHLEAWRFASLARAGTLNDAAFKRAQDYYESAIGKGPKDALLHVAIAMLVHFRLMYQISHGEFEAPMFDAAMGRIRKAIELKHDMIHAWTLQVEMDSRRLIYLRDQGVITDHDFAAARDRTEEAPEVLSHIPIWHVGLSSLYASYYNHLINTAVPNEEIYEQGVRHCKKAIQLDPKLVGAYINMGVLKSLRVSYMMNAGIPFEDLFTEAVEAFEKARSLDPESFQALNGLASMYAKHYRELLKRGNDSDFIFNRAEEMYAQAIKAAPTSMPTRYNVARLHVARYEHAVKQGRAVPAERLEATQRYCEAVLNQNPTFPAGKELMAEFLYYKVLAQSKDQSLDQQDLDRAFRANEDSVAAGSKLLGYLRLGSLCEIKGETAKALDFYTQGLDKSLGRQDRAQLLAARGKLEMKLELKEPALKDLEEAVQLDANLSHDLVPLIDSLKSK